MVTCKFCGRTVLRPVEVIGKQVYCTYSCSRRDRAEDVIVPDVEPAFGHWLAGLADGEGTFIYSPRTTAAFRISLREDDSPVLEMIHRTLGFGQIYTRHESRFLQHDNRMFNVSSTKACAALVAIFQQFPLRSKKARDFKIWSEIVGELRRGGHDRQTLERLAVELVETRKYTMANL